MHVILTMFTVLGIIFMPLLVTAMASGFIGDSRFDLASLLWAHRLPVYFVHLAVGTCCRVF